MTKTTKDQQGTAELPFTGDYTGSCLPFGQLRSMNSRDPIQIMQSPTYVALLYQQNTWFHWIPIGKKHREGVTPTWFGDPVGHWDGDTFVVDTVNFNDPRIFTKPWSNQRITLRPDWEIMEYSCEENNKDLYAGHLNPPPR
jgi:hypothetical protein